MTKEKNHRVHPKIIRDSVILAVETADQIHECEKRLVEILNEIDRNRYYVRFGFKSLSGFCIQGLKLSKTQCQRIVTLVRRYEPTTNIGIRDDSNEEQFFSR